MHRARGRKGAMSQDMDKKHRWLNRAGKHTNAWKPLSANALTHLQSTSCEAALMITLVCSVWQQTGTDQNRKSEIKEEATITRTRMASHQGTPGDGLQGELEEGGDSRTTTQRPGQWPVLQFSLLSSTQRGRCKAGNTQMEKFLSA